VTNKIMLVEDDEALRNQLDRWLTESGYEVIPVGDGSGAVEIFKAENPNVVLMDIQLPGRNGIELVRDIREFAGTPIIMVTARSEAEVMDEAFQAGADDYFEKSLGSRRNCLPALRTACESSSAGPRRPPTRKRPMASSRSVRSR